MQHGGISMKKLCKRLLCVLLAVLLFGVTANAAGDDDPLTGRLARSRQSGAVRTNADYEHDARFRTGYDIETMIDVSYHNGTVDWTAVAADGIKYAMIRIGYRGYGDAGVLREDTQFVTNIRGAQAAGIKVGVYFYTQATNNAEAAEEADLVLEKLSGYDLQLPVAYDCEFAESGGHYTGRFYNANLSKNEIADLCLAFCDRIAAGGYDAMIYANPFMFTSHINVARLGGRYPVWLAAYRTAANYDGDYIMWQYTSTGSCKGVSGNVDKSFYYIKQGVPAEPVYLQLTTDRLTLTVGETGHLTAHGDVSALGGTDGGVAYVSSAPEVLSVTDAGVLTALAEGSATVTATRTVTLPAAAPDAAPEVKTFTDSVTITVIPVPPEPTEPDNPTQPEEEGEGILEMMVQLFIAFVQMIVAFVRSLTGGSSEA